VEIQKTFYQPPRLRTALRWRRDAPPGFRFTLKAWQLITHEPSSPTYRRLAHPLSREMAQRLGSFRPSREVQDAWQSTRQIAEALEASVVVFQCPTAFTPTEEHVRNLSNFFSSLERGNFRLAWEPRGFWPPDLILELCRRLDLIHCVDPFRDKCLSMGEIYFRLHGIGGYRYHYGDSDLEKLLSLCTGREGFVMFNNMTMKEDALRFNACLQSQKNS
jgi:uncharacterized protein YecE (DUF72 family)